MNGASGDLGEFIFGFPDVAEVPFPPILNAVETWRGPQPLEVIAPMVATPGTTYSVNQGLPILLSWSPKGFAGSYALQVSAEPDFATTLVDEPAMADAFYVWTKASPNTTYHYRVRTSNYGGTSEWSAGSFQTAAPFVWVTVPNGGQAWRRGLSYFVQWNDNLAEKVSIDLYKGGTFVGNLSPGVASTGAYKWSIPPGLTPGSDYTIRISSQTNSLMTGISDLTFSIVDPPAVVPGSITPLSDGRIRFDISAPGASQVTVMGSTNLTTWESLQTLPVNNDSATFTDQTTSGKTRRFYWLRVP